MDVAYFLKVFAALFAIMSPIANLPVFLSLTADRDAAGQRRVALTTIIGITIGSLITVFAGDAVLKLFGISIDAFRLAGGLLILFIALNMLHGNESTTHAGTEQEKERHSERDNPGVYPLTVPILLGPGTISSIVIFRQQATDFSMELAFGLAVAASVALISVTFLAAPVLSRHLSDTATSIMSRLMGMILAAIAMEMMVDSLRSLLPGLAG